MKGERRTVIITEDEPSIADAIREIVADLDPTARTEVYSSAEEAKVRLESLEGPVVLIADYNLSGPMTGVEFYQCCRELRPEAPFVLMSASDIAALRGILAALRPAPPFLRKPFSLDDAVGVLGDVLRS